MKLIYQENMGLEIQQICKRGGRSMRTICGKHRYLSDFLELWYLFSRDIRYLLIIYSLHTQSFC